MEKAIFHKSFVRKFSESLGKMTDDTVRSYKVKIAIDSKPVYFYNLKCSVLQLCCDRMDRKERKAIRLRKKTFNTFRACQIHFHVKRVPIYIYGCQCFADNLIRTRTIFTQNILQLQKLLGMQ